MKRTPIPGRALLAPAPQPKPGRQPPSLANSGNLTFSQRRVPKPQTSAEVVIPAGVAITRGPSWTHDPRYSVAPGAQVYGAGFAAAGIGRSVETGRAWEA